MVAISRPARVARLVPDGVVGHSSAPLARCGPVLLNTASGSQSRITCLPNNVAERALLYHGLDVGLQCPPLTQCCLLYASRYDANVTRQIWRARTDISLIRVVAEAATRAMAAHPVSWRWIRGHSNNLGNA